MPAPSQTHRSSTPAHRCWRVWACLLVAAGCSPAADPAAPPPVESAAREAERPTGKTNGKTAATSETWDACYLGDTKVGHVHTVVRPEVQGERSLLRTSMEQEIRVRRDGQTVRQRVVLEALETPDGELRSFESRLGGGAEESVTEGQVRDGRLELTLTTEGKRQTTEIPWPQDCRGFFALEQSLAREPMEPGEQRRLRALLPALNVIGEIEVAAKQRESTKTPFGEEPLLRLEIRYRCPQLTMQQVAWVDRDGTVRKTWDPQMDMTVYRTVKEAALAPTSGSFDLGRAVHVKVSRDLPNPHETRRVVYRARLPQGDPAAVFPVGLSQSVERLDEHTARIEVRRIRPHEPADAGDATPPAEADRDANNLIQSDAPSIREMAARVAPEERDPWKLALALEQYVGATVTSTSQAEAFASAAQVARTHQGDCTEHAVLLAALCRARGLPARVASGLVYYRDGFAYHMWNEVWIGDRWIPLDATLARGGIGAAHLKVADSNLQGVSPFAALAPVIQVIGQLELEILESE